LLLLLLLLLWLLLLLLLWLLLLKLGLVLLLESRTVMQWLLLLLHSLCTECNLLFLLKPCKLLSMSIQT
jgi:hypothetical protein